MKRTLITILIIIWWVLSLYFFWQSNRTQQINFDEVPIVTIGDIENESYHSVYFKGEKIGYTSSIRQKIPTGYLIQDVSYMRIPVGGLMQEIIAELQVATDDHLQVLNFSFEFSSDEYFSRVDGLFTDTEFSYTISTPEMKDSRKIPVEGKVYIPGLAPIIAANDNFSKKQYTIAVFDPMTLQLRNYDIYIVSKEPEISPKGDKNVYKLKTLYNEQTNTMWVDSTGNVLMEKMMNGFESFREPKEQALKFDLNKKTNFDLLTEFSVSDINYSHQILERPIAFRCKLRGIDPAIFELQDFNQAYDSTTSILTVLSEGFSPTNEDILINQKFAISPILPQDTMQTSYIQKNDRRIRNQAHKITKDNKTDTQKLQSINTWLFKNIEKEYRSSIPSALDVLSKKVGDCNEHTILFVALARSLDIPCRVNVGLVRVNDEFVYHAWAQAFADGKWQTFEPSHGYYPADATHIKLLQGSLNKQIEITRISKPLLYIYEESAGGLTPGEEFLRTRVDSLGFPTPLSSNIALNRNKKDKSD